MVKWEFDQCCCGPSAACPSGLGKLELPHTRLVGMLRMISHRNAWLTPLWREEVSLSVVEMRLTMVEAARV